MNVLAVIYDQTGRVVAEAEALLEDGRPAPVVELDAHRNAGVAVGSFVGVSSGLARYELVELRPHAAPAADPAPDPVPTRRSRRKTTEE